MSTRAVTERFHTCTEHADVLVRRPSLYAIPAPNINTLTYLLTYLLTYRDCTRSDAMNTFPFNDCSLLLYQPRYCRSLTAVALASLCKMFYLPVTNGLLCCKPLVYTFWPWLACNVAYDIQYG